MITYQEFQGELAAFLAEMSEIEPYWHVLQKKAYLGYEEYLNRLKKQEDSPDTVKAAMEHYLVSFLGGDPTQYVDLQRHDINQLVENHKGSGIGMQAYFNPEAGETLFRQLVDIVDDRTYTAHQKYQDALRCSENFEALYTEKFKVWWESRGTPDYNPEHPYVTAMREFSAQLNKGEFRNQSVCIVR